MTTLARFLRAAGAVLVARSFFVIGAAWCAVLIAGPIVLIVDRWVPELAILFGAYYGIVLGALRRELPMYLPGDLPQTAGVPVGHDDQTALWQEARTAASVAGAPEVGSVVLTLEPAVGGGRRALRIGLPLLAMLSVDELHALLAHRVALTTSGGGSLTAAMARVEVALQRREERMAHYRGWLRALLAPHAGLYLRLSRWAMRREQRLADARVAHARGEDVLRDALRVAALAPIAWEDYWRRDVAPGARCRVSAAAHRGLRRRVAGARAAPRSGRRVAHDLGVGP